MINVEESTRLQPLPQQYHSVEMWGVPNEISGPNNTAHPYRSSIIVSTMHSLRQQSQKISEECSNFPGQEYQGEFGLAAHFQCRMHDESLPVLIELPDMFLYEEGLRIIHDRGASREILHPRYLDNTCINQAIRELAWLHNEKRRLTEHLDLQFQLRSCDKLGCLDIDQLFIACQNGHDEISPLPLTARPGAHHFHKSRSIVTKPLDENQFSRAKIELDLYNKQWEEIHAEVAEALASSSAPTLLAIPWPQPSPIHTHQFQVEFNELNAATESLVWKWITHALFVEAFCLRPIFKKDEKNEATLGFVSDHGRRETAARLKALRRQMKLEKVRWHEDKVKATFGPAVATHEKVKTIWSAVINLRDMIKQELESLQN
ncbi:hypothetical protein N431DRAFT_466393 [Stipitochalara longipes BDJ]|nr:hypothetical protein N431DRAFT_466393 [Stipitochalara longipes BDJ]